MISKNFTWFLFIAAAVAAAIAIYFYSASQNFATNTAIVPENQAGSAAATLPKPTGDINDVAKDIASEAALEQEMIAVQANDGSLFDNDLKIFDELGQSYNENEF